MKISFDPAKRDATLRERGLDFADAPKLFEEPSYTVEDIRFDSGTAFSHLRRAKRTIGYGCMDPDRRWCPCYFDDEMQ